LKPLRKSWAAASRCKCQQRNHFDAASGALVERRADVLIVSNDPSSIACASASSRSLRTTEFRVIYDRREYTIAGGLISYGTSYSAAYRELGIYTGNPQGH